MSNAESFGVQGDTCRVDILTVGYVEPGVAGTVVLVREDDLIAVVDPGMVSGRDKILGPLESLGVKVTDVTDVVLSHHHPDHTVNVALFPEARVHDFQAAYKADDWYSREAEGVRLSNSVYLIETPGHTPQDISVGLETSDGLVVYTHLWWDSDGPAEDPYSEDRSVLAASRRRILDLHPSWIIPGHGSAFVPNESTPI